MGQHSARRSGAMTSVAGRSLFTATAAFALLGGSAGMAVAGEASSSGGREHSHGENADHGGKQAAESCEIPVVDPTLAAGDAAINEATHDATAPFLEAGNEAVAPVHDAVCPPAHDVLGGAEQAAPSADEGAEQATSEDTSPGADAGESAVGALPTEMSA